MAILYDLSLRFKVVALILVGALLALAFVAWTEGPLVMKNGEFKPVVCSRATLTVRVIAAGQIELTCGNVPPAIAERGSKESGDKR